MLLILAHLALASTYCVDVGSDTGLAAPADCGACNSGGSMNCSLRDAIEAANGSAGLDTIVFDASVTLVSPSGALQPINDAVVIDGAGTQSTGGVYTSNAAITVRIDGVSAGSGANGLRIGTNAIGSTVQGLSITGFAQGAGILVGASSCTIQGNFVGLRPDGTTIGANSNGILVTSADNTIGGMAAAATNVVSGNTLEGIYIFGTNAGGNVVLRNVVGTNPSGTVAIANGTGVRVRDATTANSIGAANAGNLISGSLGRGLRVDAFGTIIKGNRIGTSATGSAALPNAAVGIDYSKGLSGVIGGTGVGERNVVSGNTGGGIIVGGTANSAGTVVIGNYIGLSASGSNSVSNGADGLRVDAQDIGIYDNAIGANAENGIRFSSSGAGTAGSCIVRGNKIGLSAGGGSGRGNNFRGIWLEVGDNMVIGGPAPADRNFIGDNGQDGILVNVASNALIQGNVIGLGSNGVLLMANQDNGIYLRSGTTGATIIGNVIAGNLKYGVRLDSTAIGNVTIDANYIGTDTTGHVAIGNGQGGIFDDAPNTHIQNNVISGNSSHGVFLNQPNATLVGNIIGLNSAGTGPMGNTGSGVYAGTGGVRVGGTAAGDRNFISGNGFAGVDLSSNSARVENNVIGLGTDLLTPMGNGDDGVRIFQTSGSVIGGTGPNTGNIISGNAGAGVSVTSSIAKAAVNNRINANSVFGNGGIAIDLGGDDATSNDAGDVDDGNDVPNHGQNFPVLQSVIATPNSLQVTGTLDSLAGAYRLEFFSSSSCDPSGNGPAKRYLGALDVASPAAFSGTLTTTALADPVIVATATNATGNTSELSVCKNATFPGSIGFGSVSYLMAESDGTLMVTLERLGGASGSVGVTLTTASGTAIANVDFVGVNSIITFAEGVTSRNVQIALLDDAEVEMSETFTLTLSNPTGNATLGVAAATVTLTSNDMPAPTGPTGTSGESGATGEQSPSGSVNAPGDFGTPSLPTQPSGCSRCASTNVGVSELLLVGLVLLLRRRGHLTIRRAV